MIIGFLVTTTKEEIELSFEHVSYRWCDVDDFLSLVDNGIKKDFKDAKIEELRNHLRVAAVYDSKIWGVNHNPLSSSGGLIFNNFDGHVDFLKQTIANKFSVVDTAISDL